MLKTLYCAIAIGLSCSTFGFVRAQEAPALELKQVIPLPGVEGRIDHLALDQQNRRLFVCALGNNTVEVVDLRKGERVHSINGFRAPQGICYAPEIDRLFVTNDEGGLCRVYDAQSYRQVAELNFADDADNIRYDARAKRVYVGYGSGGLGIIDATDGKLVGSIALSAHPEAFELEQNGSRIFVNVPNARHVAVVDRQKRQVIASWTTDLAFANFPMALDESNHRLFVGCRMPSRLLVLNADSGNIVAKLEIPSDCDDIFYDLKRRRIYAVCGAGKLDIIEQADASNFRPLMTLDTAPGARTGLFESAEDSLFVAVPHRGNQQAEIRRYGLR